MRVFRLLCACGFAVGPSADVMVLSLLWATHLDIAGRNEIGHEAEITTSWEAR